jgi:chaperonin GroES
MKAVKNKIIVEVETAQEKSTTGIIIDPNKKPDRGVVVSVGEEVTFEIKVGCTVVFSEYAGKLVTVDEKDYILLNESEVYYVS